MLGIHQWSQRPGLQVVLTLLLALGVPGGAEAAKLVRLDLAMDGSARPPGDRVDAAVFFLPGEKEVQVELRGFVFRGAETEPIRVRGEANRDPAGQLLVTKRVSPGPDSSLVRVELVVPYAALDLPRGCHEVFYELAGRIGYRLVFQEPTAVTQMTVSDDVRHEMSVSRPSKNRTATTRMIVAYLPGEKTRGEQRPVEQRPLRVTSSEESTEQAAERVAVEILGAFLRTGNGRDVGPSRDERTVYFATNRTVDGGGESASDYTTSASATVTYGASSVNIPVRYHRRGQLERSPDGSDTHPGRNFQLVNVSPLSSDELSRAVAGKEVLVFVHGYNSDFSRTLMRMAQIQYDLEFSGAVVAFCWPSAGDRREYLRDRRQAGQSATALAELLRQLTPQTATAGSRPRVHLLSHSMGGRILLDAVRQLYQDRHLRPGVKRFGQAILAAPDVSADDFGASIPYVLDSALQTTYYYCTRDIPLALSSEINQGDPVGLHPFFADGLTTINADNVDMQLPFHDYFAHSWQVLLDMHLMLDYGSKPGDRRTLAAPGDVYGQRLWSFGPMEVHEAGEGR